MSAVDVLALGQSLIGKTINVLFSVPDSEPMLREITAVSTKREYGRDWLIWKWLPQGMTPHGTADCGFAGNWIDDSDFVAALAAVGGEA